MADPRFAQTEYHYRWLKSELDAGRLSGEAFERALWDAMFEADGRFWMLGANSGQWYASDGDGWAASSPPAALATPRPVAAQPYSALRTPPTVPAQRPSAWTRVLAIIVLVAVAAFAVFCFRSGYQAWSDGDRIGGGIAVGFGLVLVGAIVSGLLARARH